MCTGGEFLALCNFVCVCSLETALNRLKEISLLNLHSEQNQNAVFHVQRFFSRGFCLTDTDYPWDGAVREAVGGGPSTLISPLKSHVGPDAPLHHAFSHCKQSPQSLTFFFSRSHFFPFCALSVSTLCVRVECSVPFAKKACEKTRRIWNGLWHLVLVRF